MVGTMPPAGAGVDPLAGARCRGTEEHMDPAALDADTAAWIRSRLRDEGVDDSYFVFVVRHLVLPDVGWRWCCSSNCDPCVNALGRVVDAARTRLGTGPGV